MPDYLSEGARWLRQAEKDLDDARFLRDNGRHNLACFQGQQAAEKAVKAVMILRNIDFPYVHNLALLLSMLEENGEDVPDRIRRAVGLTPYAVDTRYPGVDQPVSEEAYRDAIEIAEAVIQWAEERATCRED